jgi:hypothetical protein
MDHRLHSQACGREWDFDDCSCPISTVSGSNVEYGLIRSLWSEFLIALVPKEFACLNLDQLICASAACLITKRGKNVAFHYKSSRNT